MRIRGATTELEEAGLETDGMAKSTSDLRDLVKSMTGFDIMEDETTFKSIYDIIVGIGKEWDNINDVDRSALLQKLAGKAQGNALAAALSNVDVIEEAYGIAENSEGSAMREQETWEGSIDAKIEKMKASLQTLATDVLSSDLFGGLIEGATQLINLIDTLVSHIGVLGTALGAIGAFKIFKKIPGLVKSGAIGDWLVGKKPIDESDPMSILSAANGVPPGKANPAKFVNNGPKEIVSNYAGASGVAAETAKAGAATEGAVAETAKAGAASEAAAAEAEYAAAATEGAAAATEGAAAETAKAGAAEATAAAMGSEAAGAGTVTAEVGATAGEMGVVAGEAGVVAGEMGTVATETGAAAGGALTFSAALGTMLPWILGATAAIAALAYISSQLEPPTFDEKMDVFEDQKSNYEEQKTQLDDYGSQIQSIDEKIQEINSHDKLTLTDEAELEKLKAQKSELEQLRRIQQNKVKQEKSKTNEKALDAWNADDAVTDLTKSSYQFQTSTYRSEWVEGKSGFEEGIENNISKLREYQRQRQEILDEMENGTKTQEDLDEIEESISKTKDSLLKDVENIQEIREGFDQGNTEGFKAYQLATRLIDEANNAVSGNTASPLSQMTSLLDNAFKSSAEGAAKFSGSIKDYMVNAVKEGKNATDALSELGLTMDDIGIKDIEIDLDGDGNIDKTISATESLNRYFKDLAGSAKKAGDEISKIKMAVDGTFDGVKEAQDTANQGANWDSLTDWIASGEEAFKKGLIGTDDFKTLAEFITPGKVKTKGAWTNAEAYADAWEKNLKKVKGYFNKEDPTEGMKKFLTDAKNAKIAKVSDDFSKVTTSFETTAEAADKMGVSVEVVEAMLGKLKEYGFEFDGVTESGQQLKDYNTELEKLKTLYDEMPEDDPRKKTLGNQIKGFNEAYAQYEKDLSQLDKEAIVHIKFEYDLAEIENRIKEIENDIRDTGWTAEKGASHFSELENATDKLEEQTGVNEKNNKAYGSAQAEIDRINKKLKSADLDKEDRENLLQRKEVAGALKKDYQDLLATGKKIDWEDYLGGERALNLVDNMAGITDKNKDKTLSRLQKKAEKSASEKDKNETKENLLPYNDLEKNRRYYNKNKKNMTEEGREGYARQWKKQAKKAGYEDADLNDNENLVVDKTESNKRIKKKNGQKGESKTKPKTPKTEPRQSLDFSEESKNFNKNVIDKFISDVSSGKDFRPSKEAVDNLSKLYKAPLDNIIKDTYGSEAQGKLKDFKDAQERANKTSQEMLDIWDKNKGVELKPASDTEEVPATRGGMPITPEETPGLPRGRKRNITGEGEGVHRRGEGLGYETPVGEGSYLSEGGLATDIDSSGQGFAANVSEAGQALVSNIQTVDTYLQNKELLEQNGLTGNEQYGNVDIGNRQRVYWNEDTWNQYKDAIQSYNTKDYQITDVSQMGDYSTIWSHGETYDGTTITFTPMLQGEDGQPEMLSSDTMNNYIGKVIETAKQQYGDDWNLEENLLKTDQEGIDRSELGLEGEGKVSNMLLGLGDIGQEAHLVDQYINSLNDVQAAADAAGMTVDEFVKETKNSGKEADRSGRKFEQSADQMEQYGDSAEQSAAKAKDVTDAVTKQVPGPQKIETKVDSSALNQEVSQMAQGQTIKFTADVSGVDSTVEAYKEEDGTITYKADVGGVEQEVEPVKEQDGSVKFEAKNLENVKAQAKAAAEGNEAKVKVNAEVSGQAKPKDMQAKVKYTLGSQAKPKTMDAKVNYTKGSQEQPSTANATVNYTGIKKSLPDLKQTVNVHYNKIPGPARGTVRGRSNRSTPAYANGTNSFIRSNSIRSNQMAIVNELGEEGIIRDGRMFTVNNGYPSFIGLQKNDVVVNHKDMAEYEKSGTLPFAQGTTQGIVRDGKFYESDEHPKTGDIVFSSEQMEELNTKGYISNSHAKIVGGMSAFASGSYEDIDPDEYDIYDMYDENDELNAYVKGTIISRAYATTGKGSLKSGGSSNKDSSSKSNKKSSSGGKSKGGKSGGKSSKSNKNNKNGKSSTDKFNKWLGQLIDWIEVCINRLDRSVNMAKEAADNAQYLEKNVGKYKGALSNLNIAIAQTRKELDKSRQGETKYRNFANKTVPKQARAKMGKKWRKKWTNKNLAKLNKKIQNGSIDITKYGEETRTYIQEYQKWYEKALAEEERQAELQAQITELYKQRLENIAQWFDNISSKWSARAGSVDSYIDLIRSQGEVVTSQNSTFTRKRSALEADVVNRKSAYDRYRKELQEQLNSGNLKNGTKNYHEAMSQLYGLEEAYYNANKELQEFRQSLVELDFEGIENALKIIQAGIDLLDKRNNYSEEIGNKKNNPYTLTEGSYQEVIDADITKIAKAYEQYTKALGELSKYEKGSDPWNDMHDKVVDARSEIIDLGLNIEEASDKIREIRWKPFEEGVERIEKVNDRLETLQDLLNDDNFLDKKGILTEEGITNLMLMAQMIDNNNGLIDVYRKRLDKLQEELDNNVISLDEYNEQSSEAIDKTSDLAKTTDSYRKNILEQYLDSLEKQNQLFEEQIDLRSSNLDKLKQYYDYERSMRKQSRDISYLEQQIAALSGGSNKAAAAKLASLQEQLAEAREQQEDDQFDHMIEVRQNGYDRLKQDASDAFDQLTDKINRDTELQNKIISEMLANAQTSYKDVYDNINKIIEDNGLVFDNTTNTIIENINKTATELGNLGDKYGLVQQKAEQFKTVNKETGIDTVSTNKINTGNANQKVSEMFNSNAEKIGSKDVNETKDLKVTELQKGGSTSGSGSAKKSAMSAKVGKQSGPATNPNIALQQKVDKYVKKYGKKGNKSKKSGYGDFNKKLFSKTGYILSAEHRKGLAKTLGVAYNNDKTTGNLYKKLKAIDYFAKGSKYIPADQFGWTQDKGQELVYKRADGTILTPLGKGDKVFTADMTDNLWKIAKMNTEALTGNIMSGDQVTNINNHPSVNVSFDNLIHVEGNIDSSNIDQMKRIANDAVNNLTKQLSHDLGMYGHKLKF